MVISKQNRFVVNSVREQTENLSFSKQENEKESSTNKGKHLYKERQHASQKESSNKAWQPNSAE